MRRTAFSAASSFPLTQRYLGVSGMIINKIHPGIIGMVMIIITVILQMMVVLMIQMIQEEEEEDKMISNPVD